jgi:hypothetical protein
MDSSGKMFASHIAYSIIYPQLGEIIGIKIPDNDDEDVFLFNFKIYSSFLNIQDQGYLWDHQCAIVCRTLTKNARLYNLPPGWNRCRLKCGFFPFLTLDQVCFPNHPQKGGYFEVDFNEWGVDVQVVCLIIGE